MGDLIMDKERALLSVVIPVFNAEEYLDCCITSIVNQSYKNLEIILVDDGSKDKSSVICDEWGKKDNRVKVIHKKNEGPGIARNIGIEMSGGDILPLLIAMTGLNQQHMKIS